MVIVFARAPVAGQAKTRLAPRLGEAGAARLQARLTLAALHTAVAARCGPVALHATARHALLVHIARRMKIALHIQRGADLGERMERALRKALRRSRSAVLIGSDCPELTPRDLRRAVHLLEGAADAVLAPAQDGGYALVGLSRPAPFLFAAMRWGSASVYRETAARLERAGWRWRALRTVSDLDRPEDLERLRSLRFFSGARRRARR